MKFIRRRLDKYKELSKIKKVTATIIMVPVILFVCIFAYSVVAVVADYSFGTDFSGVVNNEDYKREQAEKEKQKELEKAEKEKARLAKKEKEKLEKELAQKEKEKAKQEKAELEKAQKEKELAEKEKAKLEKEKAKLEKELAKEEKEKIEKESEKKENEKIEDKKKEVTMVEDFVNIDNKMSIDEAKKLLSKYGKVEEYKSEVEGLEGIKYTSTEISVKKSNQNSIVLTFRNKEMSGKTYLIDGFDPVKKDWAYVNYKTSLGGENSHGIWDKDDTLKNLSKGKSIKEFNQMVVKLYK